MSWIIYKGHTYSALPTIKGVILVKACGYDSPLYSCLMTWCRFAVEFDNDEPENKCVCDLKSTELRAVNVYILICRSIRFRRHGNKNISDLVHFYVICRALMALKYFKEH